MNIMDLQGEAHDLARSKGFWDMPAPTDRNVLGMKLMLVVTELSEALEELRDGRMPHEVRVSSDGKPEGFGVELADAVIRIADLADACGINLDECIYTKMLYNRVRPHKHGRTC